LAIFTILVIGDDIGHQSTWIMKRATAEWSRAEAAYGMLGKDGDVGGERGPGGRGKTVSEELPGDAGRQLAGPGAICAITGNQPYAALLLVDDQRAGGQALTSSDQR